MRVCMDRVSHFRTIKIIDFRLKNKGYEEEEKKSMYNCRVEYLTEPYKLYILPFNCVQTKD